MAKIKNQNIIIVGGKEPVLQEKSVEIKENGTTTYTADAGFDGLKSLKVITNVAGSGGGGGVNPKLIERTATAILPEDLQGVTKIGDYVFTQYLLDSIELPEGITQIGNYSFAAPSSSPTATKLSLPTTLKEIGTSAFVYRTFASDIILPGTIDSIGSSAFETTNGVCNGYILSVGAKSIGDYAFQKRSPSTQNQKLRLLEGVENINYSAFANSNSTQYGKIYGYALISQLPSTLKSIGAYAFQNCGFRKAVMGVDTLIIPDGVTNMAGSVFRNCGISDCDVIVGSGVTTLYASLFYRFGYNYSASNYPKTLTFLGNITTIYADVFAYSAFSKIDFSNSAAVPSLNNTSAFTSTTCNIVVPDALYDEWIAATNWSVFASRIIKKSEDV